MKHKPQISANRQRCCQHYTYNSAPLSASLSDFSRFISVQKILVVHWTITFNLAVRQQQRFVTPALRQRCMASVYKRRSSPCCDKPAQTRPNEKACVFYDRMTVHRNRFLVNKTNKCIEFQFYWYYYSTCFGQSFCPSSGVLSRTSALVHFMQLWWTVCYQE